MSRSTRGFTMMELAIVVSITSLVVPAVFLLGRMVLNEQDYALKQLEVADSTRALGEELRVDLRAGHFAAGDGLRLEGPGPCFPVEYALRDGAVVRHAPAECGADRALARNVVSLSRTGEALTVLFGFASGGDATRTTQVVVALGGGR